MSQAIEAPKTAMQKVLDVVEKAGNKVPHPAIIFLLLIAIVVVVSAILGAMGTSHSTYVVIVPEPPAIATGAVPGPSAYDSGTTVSYQAIDPAKYRIETRTVTIRSLLTAEGIRFIYSSLIPSFMGFTALGLMIVALVGAGVAEGSGLVQAVIRKLVIVSPGWAMTYILAFIGIVASIAADAAYLVLIPLGGTAFLSLRRHPLAGLALGFAAVAGAFTVNMLIKPLDAVLVEFTNDAIRLVDPTKTIGLTSNLWFSIASVIFLTFLIAFITERLVEPRLGEYQGEKPDEQGAELSADETRGLKWAVLGLLGVLVVFGLLALPPGAPLRNPDTGVLIGNSPFMNGLITLITVVFLVSGAAYGVGAKTMKSATDIIKAIEKALAGMGSLIFLFLIISQFVAYFNYTNMGTIMALKMSDGLKTANIGPFWLLIGFILVVLIVDFLITGAIAKWAIFAPVFVPLLVKLSVDPSAVLAAYRIGDSPINAITPLNAYFALVVGFAQKYDKTSGVGTIVSLMLPYVSILIVLWTLLFAVWYLLGLPWGL
ncbi:MAG: AbgT family transporter [Zetaproteobacteria bacterium]|nr:MAG: AbgT family transporter [Zetaproteobacteria bacterium]